MQWRRSKLAVWGKICISERRAGRILYLEAAMKRLTDLVSEGFIWSIGITRPRPGKERVAAIYITVTLVASLLLAAGMFLLLLSRI